MSADSNRAHGALLQTTIPHVTARAHGALLHPLVGARHASAGTKVSCARESDAREEHQGHHALRKGRVSIANSIYLVTTTTFERQKLFADFSAACAAAQCFEKIELLGDATMLAWVLMPDHVHWLLQLGARDKLSKVIDRIKSASGRHTNIQMGRSGAVWAKAFHDHALRDDEDIQHVARYIVANPLRAGLVTRIGDYPFWNAVWL